MSLCTLKRLKQQAAFTITELLVVVSVMGVLSAVAIPEVSSFRGQMEASEDIRKLSSVLGELRAEAIRSRSSIRVSFNDRNFEWDIFDDSVTDGSVNLKLGSSWSGSNPTDLVFNGLGLLRGVGSSGMTITIVNRGNTLSLTVNKNGYISL